MGSKLSKAILDEAAVTGDLDASDAKLKKFPKKLLKSVAEATEIPDVAPVRKVNLSRNGARSMEEGCLSEAASTLTELNLSTNALSELPKSLGSMVVLTSLDLSSNSLSTVPRCILGIVTLKSLFMKANSLSGVPEEISRLVNLEHLDVSQNSLVKLPFSIGAMIRLQTVDVSLNMDLKVPPPDILMGGIDDIRAYMLEEGGSSLKEKAEVIRAEFDKERLTDQEKGRLEEATQQATIEREEGQRRFEDGRSRREAEEKEMMEHLGRERVQREMEQWNLQNTREQLEREAAAQLAHEHSVRTEEHKSTVIAARKLSEEQKLLAIKEERDRGKEEFDRQHACRVEEAERILRVSDAQKDAAKEATNNEHIRQKIEGNNWLRHMDERYQRQRMEMRERRIRNEEVANTIMEVQDEQRVRDAEQLSAEEWRVAEQKQLLIKIRLLEEQRWLAMLKELEIRRQDHEFFLEEARERRLERLKWGQKYHEQQKEQLSFNILAQAERDKEQILLDRKIEEEKGVRAREREQIEWEMELERILKLKPKWMIDSEAEEIIFTELKRNPSGEVFPDDGDGKNRPSAPDLPPPTYDEFVNDDVINSLTAKLNPAPPGNMVAGGKTKLLSPDEAAKSYPNALARANSSECIVCFERGIDTVLLNCGHAMCCHVCAEELATCPLCRSVVARYVKIFL